MEPGVEGDPDEPRHQVCVGKRLREHEVGAASGWGLQA